MTATKRTARGNEYRSLFPEEPINGFRDPAFAENRGVPVHRWVPWIAGFSAQFVDDAIREFIPSRRNGSSLILDPFAGVGTTLLQAVLHDHDAVGYEINPYAALVTRTKLSAISLDRSKLTALVTEVKANTAAPTSIRQRQPPPGFRSRIPFFSASVQPQICDILGQIDRIPDGTVKDIARIALGSVMVSVSNYTYEPSLSSRPGSGKALIESADVPAVFLKKLEQILEDVAWLQEKSGRTIASKGEVHCANFLTNNDALETGSVDLVVTSPPYMNNYHYVRNSRPQMFWLSLVSQSNELRRLEECNFGKFWQTVRDAAPIPLQCDHPDLAKTLNALRQTRTEKGAYGGPGWANYVASYFNDCDCFLQGLRRALARNGVAVIVIGNSIIQGIPVATDRILADLGEQKNFKLETILPLRSKRVGASITSSSVRCGNKTEAKLYENAVVLRKR
jgi:hypothetical protein